MLWVHEELIRFFKTLKGIKSEQGRSGLGKKVTEMKSLLATALRSAPKYHLDRRLYLTSVLKHYVILLGENPGLLGPRLVHVLKAVGLARDELAWLLRHQNNVPADKKAYSAKSESSSSPAERASLRKSADVVELVFAIQVFQNWPGFLFPVLPE